MFNAGTFKSLVYDPATGRSRVVPTPDDMFCAGHTFLGNGNLLDRGRHPALRAARRRGDQRRRRRDGQERGPGRRAARRSPPARSSARPRAWSTAPATSSRCSPANKVATRRGATVTASETIVFAEAVAPGPQYVAVGAASSTRMVGSPRPRRQNIYALGQAMTHGEAGLPGHRGDLRVQPVHRDLRACRRHVLQALVPDADPARGRQRHLGLRARRHRRDPRTGRTRSTTRPPGGGPSARTSPSTSRPTRRCSRPRARTSCSTPARTPGYGSAEQGRVPGFWNLKNNMFTPSPGCVIPTCWRPRARPGSARCRTSAWPWSAAAASARARGRAPGSTRSTSRARTRRGRRDRCCPRARGTRT